MFKPAFIPRFPGLTAGFTSRAYGDRPDSLWLVAEGLEPDDFTLYMPLQKHTDHVLAVTGQTREGQVADAVVTSDRGVLLGVRVADCVPVLLYDPSVPAVGAVHAGWRGTAMAILVKAIRKMVAEYGSSEENVHVAVGPSIRGCCYNVGPEVIDGLALTMEGTGWYEARESRVFVDLAAVNRLQAVEAGVSAVNVHDVRECTSCLNGTYFSYRRQGPGAGRQAGFIGIHRPEHDSGGG